MRLPRPRPLAAPPPGPAQDGALNAALELLRGGQLRVLALAGLATFFVSFDSAVLFLALSSIAAEFRTPVSALTRMGSVLALGTLAGLPVAMQADRLGRRRLLVVAVAGFSLANLASAWAPTLAWLAACRTVAVGFETVAGGVAVALVVEEVAPGQRGLAVAAITVAAGAGTGLTTLLYPLLAPNWRALYLIGSSGLVAAGILAALLRESEAWTASVSAAGARQRLPLQVLLRPPWRARLAVVSLSAALSSLLYQPASLLVALYASRDLGLMPAAISAVVVVAGAASTPAFLVGGRLSDRAGRRLPGVALSVLASAFVAATFSGGRVAYWTGNVLWSVLASASVPVLGAWYGELFPTRARATSEAVNAVAGAVGGIGGYQLVGLLLPQLGLGHSLAATAAGALLGSALLLLLPETRGEPLPA